MIATLLVDDHEITRAGIKFLLIQNPKVKIVGEASNWLEALRLAKTLDPQLVFMDIHMPGIDGLETTRKMVRSNPHAKIIIVSMFNKGLYPSRLLGAGAVGYLSKCSISQEIPKAVRVVLSGQHYISPVIAHHLALHNIDNKSGLLFDLLSLRELQVALLILNGKEINDIANLFFVSGKTIMGYRNSLFKKLHVQNEVQLILLAKKLGMLDTTI